VSHSCREPQPNKPNVCTRCVKCGFFLCHISARHRIPFAHDTKKKRSKWFMSLYFHGSQLHTGHYNFICEERRRITYDIKLIWWPIKRREKKTDDEVKRNGRKIFFSNLFIYRMLLWRDTVILDSEIKTNSTAVTTKIHVSSTPNCVLAHWLLRIPPGFISGNSECTHDLISFSHVSLSLKDWSL
jgi:hypothetical protein